MFCTVKECCTAASPLAACYKRRHALTDPYHAVQTKSRTISRACLAEMARRPLNQDAHCQLQCHSTMSCTWSTTTTFASPSHRRPIITRASYDVPSCHETFPGAEKPLWSTSLLPNLISSNVLCQPIQHICCSLSRPAAPGPFLLQGRGGVCLPTPL